MLGSAIRTGRHDFANQHDQTLEPRLNNIPNACSFGFVSRNLRRSGSMDLVRARASATRKGIGRHCLRGRPHVSSETGPSRSLTSQPQSTATTNINLFVTREPRVEPSDSPSTIWTAGSPAVAADGDVARPRISDRSIPLRKKHSSSPGWSAGTAAPQLKWCRVKETAD